MLSIRIYMTAYYVCHELIQRQIQSNTNTKINFSLFELIKQYAIAQMQMNFKSQNSFYLIQLLFKLGLSNDAQASDSPIILSCCSACRKFIPIVCRKISCLSLFVTLRVSLMQWIFIIRIQQFILNSYVSDDRQTAASRSSVPVWGATHNQPLPYSGRIRIVVIPFHLYPSSFQHPLIKRALKFKIECHSIVYTDSIISS